MTKKTNEDTTEKTIKDIADKFIPEGCSVHLCNDSIILLMTRDSLLQALDTMEEKGNNKVIIAIPFDPEKYKEKSWN